MNVKLYYRRDWLPVGASRLRVERRGERRVLTKYEEAREWPLQYARRFGAFFESTIEKLKGKCVNESSVGTERMEWTLLQMNGKLKYDSGFYGFCFLNEVRLKEANAIWRNPQKMWQTWSLSDLAGEPNPSNGRPLVNKLRSRPNWDFKGDEVVATDDVWGRYKEN